VQDVDHVTDVRVLDSLDQRVEWQHLQVVDGGRGYAVDVVAGVERVALDVVRCGAEVQGPAVEEHDPDVDARLAGGDHPLPQPLEVAGVQPVEVEPGPAVLGRARTRPDPGLRGHVEVVGAAGRLRSDLLPAPEPDEVVPAVAEEVQVRGEVQPFRLVRRLGARAHAVLQVVPDVRAGEVDRAAGVLAGRRGEVARVAVRDDQRTRRRSALRAG
jgi:hypothetical protein